MNNDQAKKKDQLNRLLKEVYKDDGDKPAFLPWETFGKMMCADIEFKDKTVLVVSDCGLLVSAIIAAKKHGLNLSLITFLCHNEKQRQFAKNRGIKDENIDVVCYNNFSLQWIEDYFVGLTFDIALMNAPYLNGLHMDFLYRVIECTKTVVSIQPATDFIKTTGRQDTRFPALFAHLKSVQLMNANAAFPAIKLGVPLAVSHFDLNYHGPIKFSIDENSADVTSADQITIHAFKPGFNEFKNLMIEKAEATPFSKFVFWSSNKGAAESYQLSNEEWFIEGAGVIGNIVAGKNNTNPRVDNILKPDATTFILNGSSRVVPRSALKGGKHQFAIGFKTKAEAESCLSYVRTTFARAALSIHRYGTGLGRPHFSSVPAVPWDRIWTDDEAIRYFDVPTPAQTYLKTIPMYHV